MVIGKNKIITLLLFSSVICFSQCNNKLRKNLKQELKQFIKEVVSITPPAIRNNIVFICKFDSSNFSCNNFKYTLGYVFNEADLDLIKVEYIVNYEGQIILFRDVNEKTAKALWNFHTFCKIDKNSLANARGKLAYKMAILSDYIGWVIERKDGKIIEKKYDNYEDIEYKDSIYFW